MQVSLPSRGVLRFVRAAFTLLAAAAIILAIWQRLAPRFEKLSPRAVVAKPLDSAFHRLSAAEVAALPLALRFDHPLGSQHGAMTYNAQPFRLSRHLGDDLNGIGGQNSDLGDPVYAAGTGRVVYAGDGGPGWGGMVILAHRVPVKAEKGRGFQVWQTVYAHLEKIHVRLGRSVERGESIGTVGTAGGRYLAHLHFEIREGPYVNPGSGYADTPMNRVSPEAFLRANRGAADDLLSVPPRAIVAGEQAELEVQMETDR